MSDIYHSFAKTDRKPIPFFALSCSLKAFSIQYISKLESDVVNVLSPKFGDAKEKFPTIKTIPFFALSCSLMF